MAPNLIIGSSHAISLVRALGSIDATWQEASLDLVPVQGAEGRDNYLLFTTNRPQFLELRSTPSGQADAVYGPLIEKVRRFDQPGCKVVFVIGGNEHNIRFLCRHPKPFDFVHPASPGVDPSRQILPAVEMTRVISELLSRTFLVTRLLAAEVRRAELFYLPPPPPIPSEDHIRQYPEVFDFTKHQLEDAGLRLKIYSLYLEAARAFCANESLRFLEPPSQHRDERGFLRAPFWEGSTHAAPEYYAGLAAEVGL